MMHKRPHWHVSSRGIVRLTGPDRLPFVQRMCTQDVRPLSEADRARLALFLNAKGRLIDEVQVLSDGDALVLETAAHRAQALVQWLTPYTIMEELSYAVDTEAAATFIVSTEGAGPGVQALGAVLQSLGFAHLPVADEVVRAAPLRAWATAPRPAFGPGTVITAPGPREATLIADALQAAFGPVLTDGQKAEWLMGTGVASPELDYPTPAAPFELRLGQDSIHWHKGCYIGQEIISRLEAYDKVARLMMGVTIAAGSQQPAAPAAAARIFVADSPVGKLSRAVPDATGLNLVGLCLVKRDYARPMAVDLVDQAGHRFAGQLFDCPQWQR